MRVLRLAGSPGVGKSAVGWAVADQLARRAERVAYVDIDQLGMCYPAPGDDPHRYILKEQALDAVLPHYRRAGAERLVVSGVASPDLPPPEHAGTPATSLWLDATPSVRRSRLARRRWSTDAVAETVRIGTTEAKRVGAAWERLDTNGQTVDQTVDEVLARWEAAAESGAGWPADPPGRSAASTRLVGVPLLWITGPRCAGASTVGFLVATAGWERGRPTGFCDLAQLSFGWNLAGSPGLANTVALQQTFVAAGAEQLVVVAPLGADPTSARTALGAAEVRVVRLDASEDDLQRRAEARVRGEGALLAGDDVVGGTAGAVEAVVASAVAARRLPVRPGEVLFDTTGTTAQEAAARVRAAWTT